MDFITTQAKLSKAEWESIEVPCIAAEKEILQLIQAGASDVNIHRNSTLSLLKYMKIVPSEQINLYIYVNYLQPIIKALTARYVFPFTEMKSNERSMKKADLIRLNNTEKQLAQQKDKIFEFILLELLTKMCEEASSKNAAYNAYYTLKILLTYKVEFVNPHLLTVLTTILHAREKNIDIAQLIYNGQKIIEQNPYLLKYADETLYDHQKQLFTICKQPTPKLVLYIAPTGTGKTMSPIGLSETHRVIFVCAARHVGLALAKASISIQKKIAFAFGCNDAVDIRLHYYAAKDYTKNSKSGGIGKVDNSQGEKVEIMISDVQSYLPAMLYMLAFNPKEKIITYWDEPTITMDYAEHDLHAIIQKNWTHNLIPNMVLSSATLPQCDEINETIRDFCARFEDVGVHEILSYDCKKTIPMINREGFVEMPHYLYTDYADIVAVTEHCKKNKTLLRYIDLGEAIRFIKYIHAGASGAGASGAGASGAGASGAGASASASGAGASTLILNPRYTIQNHFTDLGTITMANIKLFYLDLLGNLRPENWPRISSELSRTRPLRQPSNINITTTDAHTLTDGPTIFLADDVTKIAQFYIQQANIPDYVTKEIMSKINRNQAINEELSVCEKDMEDGTTESGKDKVQREDKMSVKMKELKQKIKELQAGIQTVILNPLYVPNTHDHLYKYASKIQAQQTQAQAFTCDIAEDVVEKIMCITDVDDYWKLLLLMGIGVFAQHKSVRYTEVMKRLAQDHKLFMIIASSDYIYGTNYQFCHGYIGKDLGAMSQEKCIQAMGRVGRNKLQQDYTIRFRDNTLIYKLFQREENKPEVANMNRLFNSDV